MYSYYLSIEAEEDIVRIFEYGFNHFGLKQAEKYYDELFECFNKIAFNPYMFPKYPPYANRSCPVCSSLILIFPVRTDTHNSGRFALTSAAGNGGQTAFPHLLTCSVLP